MATQFKPKTIEQILAKDNAPLPGYKNFFSGAYHTFWGETKRGGDYVYRSVSSGIKGFPFIIPEEIDYTHEEMNKIPQNSGAATTGLFIGGLLSIPISLSAKALGKIAYHSIRTLQQTI